MERVLEILDLKSLPSIDLIRSLCREVSNTLVQQPNVLRIDPGVKVVGSVYGQYFDLLDILNEGNPMNYLFLGNYLGSGKYSLQTILLLFCLKVKYPNKISLLRGSQQTKQISITKGFLENIYQKYTNDEPWKAIEQVFKYLPLAAIIGDSYLCISGGIQNYKNLNQIRSIPRHSQHLQRSGLLWDSLGSNLSFGKSINQQTTKKFLINNRLKMMIRGNGVFKEGFEKLGDQIISISSCPFFMEKYNNLGCILTIEEDLSIQITQFKKTDQPKDVFQTIIN